MSKKVFIPVYLEHIRFLVKRVSWVVTKIHSHYTFEQERFKKDFIIVNQNSRQKAKDYVEKYFYKLLNNSNFEYDCRNNIDNCSFEPITDELEEISYLRQYQIVFD